ncbi:MurR/RpiR family transcriptional regulator [Lactobacillus hamsteri]|uniref:Transcriptional regulator n=1 Tax=Lactobacillus hamsteri DSM 5661 = JCM 6256 TaxID=1423754 RepID=A0A0R1YG85_9LACO|nr:MurR/RpiR family transcriptional regulator [Lactobacillus hamsteri]KRM41183.1 transcriptional regulator [Lactobacillus hamsteri DSM 5661 = JCM 6256]
MANFKTMIMKNSDKLNDSEKQIVQFVVSNPKLCSNLSLAKLAKKLYVSESAIFRLCKKLGLSGYSELKFNLSELAAADDRPVQVVSNFGEDLSKAIQDVLKYFKGLNLENLFKDLDNANNVYIYSTGWQQELIAQYLSHELFMIGKKATVLPSALDELKAANSFTQSGDILFVISYSGNNQTLNTELAQLELTNDKFKYISFTNMKQSKLVSLAQYNFYYPAVSYTPDKDYVDGKVAFAPAYYLIDLIISEYSLWRKNHDK